MFSELQGTLQTIDPGHGWLLICLSHEVHHAYSQYVNRAPGFCVTWNPRYYYGQRWWFWLHLITFADRELILSSASPSGIGLLSVGERYSFGPRASLFLPYNNFLDV